MKIECTLEIEYKDKETAAKILKSIKVDDYDFVSSKQIDNFIVAEIKTKSISSLLHSIDDYLACLSVAERVVNKHFENKHFENKHFENKH
jgi:tRNA threonylcarbamoyladenosine modification (KEOPS) complex  Pcc1 subunit